MSVAVVIGPPFRVVAYRFSDIYNFIEIAVHREGWLG